MAQQEPDSREARIRELAYALWEAADRPHGRADEFWFAAVEILDTPSEEAAEVAVTAKRRRTKGRKD